MAKGKPRVARVVGRNPELIRGLRRHGRVSTSHRARRYLHSKKGDQRTAEQKAAAAAKKAALTAPADLSKSKYYSADDIPTPLRTGRSKKNPTVLRPSITPGAILIILAGRFRGKRVIYLKQLPSGLLLVTGPYKVNGVPLRRINQAYVIATSTRLDVGKIDVSKIDDAFFAKDAAKAKTKKDFLGKEENKTELPAARKTEQARVDAALKTVIAAVPNLKHYLNAKFTLTNGQKPHLLKF